MERSPENGPEFGPRSPEILPKCSNLIARMNADPMAYGLMACLYEVFEHEWQICEWLNSENDLLDGAIPMELLEQYEYDEVEIVAQLLMAATSE